MTQLKLTFTIAVVLILTLCQLIRHHNQDEQKNHFKTKLMTASNETNNTLVYRFLDASVPPAYHRSYTINVTPDTIYFSVDSYGTILSKKELPLSKAAYQSFITKLLALSVKNCEPTSSNGCDGGTSDYLTIDTSNGNAIKGHLYYCGGKTFGDLEGKVAEAVTLFKALIPDLKKKIAVKM